jgi:ATP/maltotriose-dependent transcriptional regulator MalT
VKDTVSLAVQLVEHWEAHGLFRAGRQTLSAALGSGDGEPAERALAYEGIARLALAQGDVHDARTAYESALELHEEARRPAATTRNSLAVVLLRAGEPAAAESTCRAALQEFLDAGDVRGEAFCWSTLGLAAAAQGDHQRSIEHFLTSVRLFRSVGALREAAAALTNLGNVAQDVGDEAAALRFFDGARQSFTRLGDLRGSAMCLHNLAMLSALRGDADHAVELSTAALDAFTQLGDVQGQAASTNNLAGLWASQGASSEAAGLYDRAAELFGVLGDHSGVETARHNADVLRRTAPGLSEREAQVAELVAAGLSNRDIAVRLFISQRTVDSHLSHIFTKLAVTSRTQVAMWWASRGGSAVTV